MNLSVLTAAYDGFCARLEEAKAEIETNIKSLEEKQEENHSDTRQDKIDSMESVINDIENAIEYGNDAVSSVNEWL